jgi:O-antigen/teichoic acid export membrane protein
LSTAKKFAGQTAIYGLSTIASRTLTFFLTPLYVTVLPMGGYGIFTYMFSYASVLNAVLSFGMETTFFRYLNKENSNKQEVYNNSFGAVIFISLVFLLFTMPFLHTVASMIQIGKTSFDDFVKFVRYVVIILVLDAWCVIPFAKLRADGHPGRFSLVKVINVLIFVGLNLVFLVGFPFWLTHHLAGWQTVSKLVIANKIEYIFISNIVASGITLLLLLPQVLQLRPKFNAAMFKNMLLYSWPVLVANLSFIVNENFDKLLLGKLLPSNISEAEVGIYGGCAKIAIFLSIFVQAFRLGAEPFFFSHAKNKNAGQTYARIMTYFVIAVCVIFLALTANIEILKYFIRNKHYWVGLRVIPPLLFGYVSLGIYMNLSVWYKLSDQTKYGLYISGIGAIVTIVLNVIFIPKYSYMASAYISLIAYSSMMVMSYLWGQKNYPIPYDLKKNLAYIISSVILVYLSFYVFNRNIFIGNALLLLFGGAALYFEWRNLKAIFIKG